MPALTLQLHGQMQLYLVTVAPLTLDPDDAACLRFTVGRAVDVDLCLLAPGWDAKNELEDKVYRSYGILKYARTLDLDEFLNLTSAIRFGIESGILKNINIKLLNRMMLLCLPAHMELYFKTIIQREETSSIRADMVKKFLPEIIGK